jgi:hypothetical protein
MKLPDPDIQMGPWESVREGVQRNLDALASAIVGTGGKSLEYRSGIDTVTFSASNASATTVVSHGLGRIPNSVVATSAAGFGIYLQTFTWTATTFTAQGAYPFGPLSGSYTFAWMASA